jgi:mono/diheme cytochrome c family protein
MNLSTTHRLILAAVALGAVAVASAAAGQRSSTDKVPSLLIPSLSGRDIFTFYCSPCHGRDGRGNGPVAPALKTAPPDLTRLTIRNSGTFPRGRVENFVANGSPDVPAHGSREMPVWGPTFLALEPSDTLVKIRIANVVDYVESIQAR